MKSWDDEETSILEYFHDMRDIFVYRFLNISEALHIANASVNEVRARWGDWNDVRACMKKYHIAITENEWRAASVIL